MKVRTEALKAILALFVLAMLAAITIAAPYGPDAISRDKDDRRTNFAGAKQVQAQAGNVTQLTINATMLTKRWQGYYGNISGTITLDDANGYTMYDWTATDGTFAPVGEIYAANYTISDWSDVVCVNLTGDGTGTDGGSLLNVTKLETMYGMSANDADGVDETFTGTEDITIGTTTLNDCPATNMYVNNASQSNYWNETLLTENQTTTVIFAAKVDQDTNGFNNKTWDFQMIVGDNGDDAIATTTYYFYVELA